MTECRDLQYSPIPMDGFRFGMAWRGTAYGMQVRTQSWSMLSAGWFTRRQSIRRSVIFAGPAAYEETALRES